MQDVSARSGHIAQLNKTTSNAATETEESIDGKTGKGGHREDPCKNPVIKNVLFKR